MSSEKIAIVTGANKGIGYVIVKRLCETFPGKVYLTSRDVNAGKKAVENLKELGYNPAYHQLDIENQASVDEFRKYIAKTYGGVDVLVNNAGVKGTGSFAMQAEASVGVNYFGTLRMSEEFLPLLRQNANVVNVSSSLGHLAKIPSKEIRKKFADSNLTIQGLTEIMNEYLSSAKEDSNAEKDWGTLPYTVSKVGMSAMSIIHQKMVDNETPSRNIHINHVHPGYVATDLNNYQGVITVEEGAVAPVYAALNKDGWKGQYVWKDCTLVDWFGSQLPSLY